MATCIPNRLILGVPAWLWVVMPIPLLELASILWKVWLPSNLAEPSVRAEIFRELILVPKEGDSFRFVPYGEHKSVKPLWAVNVSLRDTGTVRWHTKFYLPGLFERESRWTYELTSHRFDNDWKGAFALPDEEMRRLRPLVVAELNGHNPSARAGERLEGLLTDGLEMSSYFCVQNAIILLSWLSLPMALVGLISMFVSPRTLSTRETPDAEPNAARGGHHALAV